MSKGRKYLEDDPEQDKACKEAEKFLKNSKSERLHLLLVSESENKENTNTESDKVVTRVQPTENKSKPV